VANRDAAKAMLNVADPWIMQKTTIFSLYSQFETSEINYSASLGIDNLRASLLDTNGELFQRFRVEFHARFRLGNQGNYGHSRMTSDDRNVDLVNVQLLEIAFLYAKFNLQNATIM